MKKLSFAVIKIKVSIVTALVLTLFLSSTLYAHEVNLEDKRQSFPLIHQGVRTGEVHISSRFVTEPVGAPVRIRVSVACARAFSQAREIEKKDALFSAFDYGNRDNPKQLATFEPVNQILTVYYRERDFLEGEPQPDRYLTKTYQLSGICVKR